MRLFYQRTGRSAEWNEDTAKTEFLYFIFQDYITTKQKNISEIDEFIEEMADVNEEKEFMKDGFNKTEFNNINKTAIIEIESKKINELKVLGNKDDIFQDALKFVGDSTIKDAANKLNLQSKLKITSDFDKEVYAKKGWTNQYGSYFSKVFDTMKKTEKKEKDTETKTFTLDEDKVEGNLTKVKKLKEAGFQFITKESVQGQGATGMGSMKYSRTRAVTRNFGTIRQGILDIDELAREYEDGIVATKRRGEGRTDTEEGSSIEWRYETADLLYVIQRLLFYSNELGDVKLPVLGGKDDKGKPIKQKTTTISEDFKTVVKTRRKNIKRVQELFEDLEKIVEIGQKGKKLNKTDLDKIHTECARIIEEMQKIYPEKFSYPEYKQPKEEGEKTVKGFNGYIYVFNAASRKLARKYGSRFDKQLSQLEDSNAKNTVIKNFKDRQFELYNGSVNHFLAWAVKGLDAITLAYVEDIQEDGRKILNAMEEESGLRFKQDLKAKEAWNEPEKWLKTQLTGVLNDLQHLYQIELEVVRVKKKDKYEYRIGRWNVKPKFDLLPPAIQRYTSMGPQKLGGGSFVSDEQMGAKPKQRKYISADEQVDYQTQKKVSVFAKTILRRLNEIKSVI